MDGFGEDRIELYWLPLGAGGHSVRLNGKVYESLVAAFQRRGRLDLFHAGLLIFSNSERYAVEMTPVPSGAPEARGVVATGPVGSRLLGGLRLFRYEIRCWPGGAIPDIEYAVASPVTASADSAQIARVLNVIKAVPTPTWGRDELSGGEMWNSNSMIAWTLERSGVNTDEIPLPANGRAPGWDAGRAIARRAT